ncbi:gamma-glutamylcyclotransferase [Pseudomonas putida]
MAKRPGHGEIWLFAYGSLIWNPLLDFVRREIATLKPAKPRTRSSDSEAR